MAVTKSEVIAIPPVVTDKVDVAKCSPFFAGMKYCTALEYTDAVSQETSPYFPITGNSKWVFFLNHKPHVCFSSQIIQLWYTI